MLITIQEAPITEAIKVNNTITEFKVFYTKEEFEKRYENKETLILVAYIDSEPAGYLVGYNKFNDKSFYCWMAGVNPIHREKGVLKALMDYQEKWAREKGYTSIKIKTQNKHRRMLLYLVKYGFSFTGAEGFPSIEDNRIFLEKKLL